MQSPDRRSEGWRWTSPAHQRVLSAADRLAAIRELRGKLWGREGRASPENLYEANSSSQHQQARPANAAGDDFLARLERAEARDAEQQDAWIAEQQRELRRVASSPSSRLECLVAGEALKVRLSRFSSKLSVGMGKIGGRLSRVSSRFSERRSSRWSYGSEEGAAAPESPVRAAPVLTRPPRPPLAPAAAPPAAAPPAAASPAAAPSATGQRYALRSRAAAPACQPPATRRPVTAPSGAPRKRPPAGASATCAPSAAARATRKRSTHRRASSTGVEVATTAASRGRVRAHGRSASDPKIRGLATCT